MTTSDRVLKRTFDFIVSLLGLIGLSWLIILAWLLASIDTRANGLFTQTRIGRQGKPFTIFKIRTMRSSSDNVSTVTTLGDSRVTQLGNVWRRTKIDELPQLINIVFGQMSFVGPRPDVPGFMDELKGEDRVILELRPGVTGPATLKYRDEETLLASVEDPETYNREVIFPDKVEINKAYLNNYSLIADIKYIVQTVTG